MVGLAFVAGCLLASSLSPRTIHSVSDISHEFTFYMDGRFAGQYLPGANDARNWGTLHKLDISNVNLLILASGASPNPYCNQDLALVRRLLSQGGGVLVMGDYARFREETKYHLNDLVRAFGVEFVDRAAVGPIKTKPDGKELQTYGGKVLRLTRGTQAWTVLAEDAEGHPVALRRSWGPGTLLVVSRALSGRNPDASDPINAEWWQPMLAQAASGKQVDPAKPNPGQGLDNVEERQGLRIRYSDDMKGWADSVFDVYREARPHLERIMGVPPSPGMLGSMILLATGGGGFSDGTNIGIGVWWGDFPHRRYGMVELIGHEATHSWVLPFPEPMWNEGIATYIGILLGKEMGLNEEAEASLRSSIEGARRHDPDMTKYDLSKPGIPHAVAMGKPKWIFEQLRKERPDVVARYFQAKRRLVDPSRMQAFTADDSVAVLSIAMGRDLFPWFRSLGTDVSRERTSLPGIP